MGLEWEEHTGQYKVLVTVIPAPNKPSSAQGALLSLPVRPGACSGASILPVSLPELT